MAEVSSYFKRMIKSMETFFATQIDSLHKSPTPFKTFQRPFWCNFIFASSIVYTINTATHKHNLYALCVDVVSATWLHVLNLVRAKHENIVIVRREDESPQFEKSEFTLNINAHSFRNFHAFDTSVCVFTPPTCAEETHYSISYKYRISFGTSSFSIQFYY